MKRRGKELTDETGQVPGMLIVLIGGRVSCSRFRSMAKKERALRASRCRCE